MLSKRLVDMNPTQMTSIPKVLLDKENNDIVSYPYRPSRFGSVPQVAGEPQQLLLFSGEVQQLALCPATAPLIGFNLLLRSCTHSSDWRSALRLFARHAVVGNRALGDEHRPCDRGLRPGRRSEGDGRTLGGASTNCCAMRRRRGDLERGLRMALAPGPGAVPGAAKVSPGSKLGELRLSRDSSWQPVEDVVGRSAALSACERRHEWRRAFAARDVEREGKQDAWRGSSTSSWVKS
ncbi:unnamed protein product [Effrenium voratum]|uniref:Uncharacterized protein n=1 Tax=Effrenium voratum TaxID=2562239 RepID=A0AA36HUY9_9DINO|nr:unnamed protein product [Effrenium voratum]